MSVKTAKLFMNGKSQAVRLPKAFRFDSATEVYIRKEGDEVILSAKAPSWDAFFAAPSAFGDDFLTDRENERPQERDFFS
jgi:antitoxin VapB